MIGNILKWIARVLGVIISVHMFLYIFGEGIPPFAEKSPREIILLIAFTVILIGLIVAWWQERIGSFIILSGTAGFWLFYTIYSGKFWIHWFFLIFPIIGVLFLLASQFEEEPPKKKPGKK